MNYVAKSVTDLIGNTPILKLQRFSQALRLKYPLYAKLEYFNPGGSVKDRVAKGMIKQAERDGLIKPGATIIEPTSGNTGVGLALVAACMGYHLVLTMPENMSIERRKLLAAYGAQVVLTPAEEGMTGAIREAERLQKNLLDAIILRQFDNMANPESHYDTTGPEIWQQMDGQIDAFVACVGTGGTVTGTGRYLREMNRKVKIVAVEPAASPVLRGGKPGQHAIQGIGAGFVPKVYDETVVNCVIGVSDQDAMSTARMLARTEGLLVGISAGAAVWAAVKLATRSKNGYRHIVVLLPDTGERYLSTELFE